MNQIKLAVPYKTQLDNSLNPSGACNVTSVAMVLEYFKIPRNSKFKGFRQYEDELYQYCLDHRLSRHKPEDLAVLMRNYGLNDDFTFQGSIERCKEHLAAGNPCIVHGYFTAFGHIIVLIGYDDKGFIVHDPYGEWFSDGYRKTLPGDSLHYSYGLIEGTCMTDNQFWVHYVSKLE